MERMLFQMMKDAAPKAQDNYMGIKDAVLHIGQMYHIPETAQRAIAANPRRDSCSGRKPTVRNLGRTGLHLTRLLIAHLCSSTVCIDCSSLNVKNIYDASLLCDHILRLKDRNILVYSMVLKASLASIKT